jgi:hypothetical protein
MELAENTRGVRDSIQTSGYKGGSESGTARSEGLRFRARAGVRSCGWCRTHENRPKILILASAECDAAGFYRATRDS